jgi:hypothetical protein
MTTRKVLVSVWSDLSPGLFAALEALPPRRRSQYLRRCAEIGHELRADGLARPEIGAPSVRHAPKTTRGELPLEIGDDLDGLITMGGTLGKATTAASQGK